MSDVSTVTDGSASMHPVPVIADVVPVVVPTHPDMEWLEIDRLFINPSYQRDVLRTGRRIIQKIAADFQWARFGIVTVMQQPEGRFAIIDGQHRCAALKSMGATLVPCLVVPEGDLKEQALHFIGINTARTALTPVAKFKARIMAEDPAALSLFEFIKDSGVRPLLYNPNPRFVKKPSINAYGNLEKLYQDSLRRFVLRKSLEVAAAISAPFIRGEIVTIIFNYLLYRPAGATNEAAVLIAALSKSRPVEIVSLVRVHRADTGDTIKDSHALVVWRLVEDYLDKQGDA